MTFIYKICARDAWRAAERSGVFEGSEVDRADGFIHFSDASTLRETARLHFRGRDDLILATVDADRLEPAPVWEPSRRGQLFPHLYAPLPLSAVVETRDLEVDDDASQLEGFGA